MAFDIWLAFVAASIALLMIPGPTILLVLSYALSHGRRVAMSTAAGVALGDLVAMTASLIGLGALVLASATLFTVLKWIGAAYLIFLGIKLLRSAPQALEPLDTTDRTAGTVFWHACAVTALNPKSIAFFIAFVPQFLNADAAIIPQFAILIATFVSLATANALVYALLADRMRARIKKPATLRLLNRTGGGALIGMGALAATLQRA